jgi:RNA polymerase sigma-70 factor (ECF subfamily)
MGAISFTNTNTFGESLMKNPKSLVELARLGDEEAFRRIFEQHHRIVLKFIYGMVGNLSLAEELMQETFLSVYRSLDSFHEERKLTPWLCGIAKNITCNWLRSNKGESFNIALDERENFEIKDDVNQSPDSILLGCELKDKISLALQTLDEDKRLVFTLKILNQLSYEDISQITGSSIPKLKTDLHRAKAEMRNLLGHYLEGKK